MVRQSCAPYQSQSVETISVALRLKHEPELRHLGLLFSRQVAWVARGGDWSDGWEVIVVIFGVKLQGSSGSWSGHDGRIKW